MAKAKKKNPDYTLIEKRNKRWSVLGKDGKYINGEEKVKILTEEGKFKTDKPKKKKKAEESVEEVVTEEVATEEVAAEEAPVEEAPAEKAPAEEAAEGKAE